LEEHFGEKASADRNSQNRTKKKGNDRRQDLYRTRWIENGVEEFLEKNFPQEKKKKKRWVWGESFEKIGFKKSTKGGGPLRRKKRRTKRFNRRREKTQEVKSSKERRAAAKRGIAGTDFLPSKEGKRLIQGGEPEILCGKRRRRGKEKGEGGRRRP